MVAKIAKFALSPALSLLGMATKQPNIPTPAPVPTRDDAIQAIAADDELAKRRGGAADILTGASGAEPARATGKSTLGS